MSTLNLAFKHFPPSPNASRTDKWSVYKHSILLVPGPPTLQFQFPASPVKEETGFGESLLSKRNIHFHYIPNPFQPSGCFWQPEEFPGRTDFSDNSYLCWSQIHYSGGEFVSVMVLWLFYWNRLFKWSGPIISRICCFPSPLPPPHSTNSIYSGFFGGWMLWFAAEFKYDAMKGLGLDLVSFP